MKTQSSVKQFTDADIDTGSFPSLYADRSELIQAPLWWHKQGLQQTSSGYGGKLTTSLKINFNGKIYRLYASCYGNASSTWFKAKGRTIYVN